MEDDRRNGLRARFERREERLELGDGDRASEPAEAGEEDELELGDDRAGDADEQIVEAAVLEVVLDAGAADPADAAVDDDELAMVDVPERRRGSSARHRSLPSGPSRHARLRRAYDADLERLRP